MSARVGIQLVPKISLPGVQRMLRAMDDFSAPLKGAVQDVRARVALEFQQGVWFMPSGGSRPWKRKQDFGTKAAGRPGIGTGDYFRALMGGAGAIEKVTPRTLTVGADANRFPYARYFRGGTGANLSLADMVVRPKKRVHSGRHRGAWVTQWAIWWYLGIKFGVWLKESTLRRGLRISPRPHLTKHPALVAMVKARMVAHLRKAA